MPEVSSISVTGTTWSIPRIDPNHFTAQQFAAVIADTAEPHPSDEDALKVEFLWLDVACINQSNGSHEKALEIGRQAKIFRGAARVFIWLTTHNLKFYESWAPEVSEQAEIFIRKDFHTAVDRRAWVSRSTELLRSFTRDPWFSSLWTLQESFLAPNAAVITIDAMKSTIDLILISHISQTLIAVKDALDFDENMRNLDLEYGLGDAIDRTGLVDGCNKNLMGLLTAAGHRSTVHEEDRVYGIMQIFDLKLGSSSPNADENQSFSLEELNDQLGMALMQRDPVLSQMHIFTTSVPPGKGWRFTRSSIVPDLSKSFYHRKHTKPEVEALATLSAECFGGSFWGTFQGRTTTFNAFTECLLRDWPNSWFYGSASIYLDDGTLNECEALDENASKHGCLHIARAVWLKKHRSDTIILLLGLQMDDEAAKSGAKRLAVGLLMSPLNNPGPRALEGVQLWQRIGIFIWCIDPVRYRGEAERGDPVHWLLEYLLTGEEVTKELPYLVGNDFMWGHSSGWFG